ncbi:hypothetical protein QVD99_006091 [Batrachochytrium dendrobatidis]|nr:hypothetical protein QVD99_006091 [Batrachochytrium dendrobatidis]
MGMVLLQNVSPLFGSLSKTAKPTRHGSAASLSIPLCTSLDRLLQWTQWLERHIQSGSISKDIVASVMDRHLFTILHKSAATHVNSSARVTGELLCLLNCLLTKCTSNKVRFSATSAKSLTKSLVALLPKLPDVRCQLLGLEFIYRLLPKLHSERASFLAKMGLPVDQNLLSLNSSNFGDNARLYLQQINANNNGMDLVPMTILLNKAKSVLLENGSSWDPCSSVCLDISQTQLALVVVDIKDVENAEMDMEILFSQIQSFSTVADSEVCMIVDHANTRQIVTLCTQDVSKIVHILDYHKVPQSSKSSIVVTPVMVHIPQAPFHTIPTTDSPEDEDKENRDPDENIFLVKPDKQTSLQLDSISNLETIINDLAEVEQQAQNKLLTQTKEALGNTALLTNQHPVDSHLTSYSPKTPSGSVYTEKTTVAKKPKKSIKATNKPVRSKPSKEKCISKKPPSMQSYKGSKPKSSNQPLKLAMCSETDTMGMHANAKSNIENNELAVRRAHLSAQLKSAQDARLLHRQTNSESNLSLPEEPMPILDIKPQGDGKLKRPIKDFVEPEPEFHQLKRQRLDRHLHLESTAAKSNKIPTIFHHQDNPLHQAQQPSHLATTIQADMSDLVDQIAQTYKAYLTEALAQVGDRLYSVTQDKSYVSMIQTAVQKRIERTLAFSAKINAMKETIENVLIPFSE